jgi:hypothetical protein
MHIEDWLVNFGNQNTNTQLILDLYVTSYCTSYVTKIDKNVTQELHVMLENAK